MISKELPAMPSTLLDRQLDMFNKRYHMETGEVDLGDFPSVTGPESFAAAHAYYREVGIFRAARKADLQGRANELIVPTLLTLDHTQPLPEFSEINDRINPETADGFPALIRKDASRIGSFTQAAYDRLLAEDPSWADTSRMLTERWRATHSLLREYVISNATGELEQALEQLRDGKLEATQAAKLAQETLGLPKVHERLLLYNPQNQGKKTVHKIPEQHPENQADQAEQAIKALYGTSMVLEIADIPPHERMPHILNNIDTLGALTRARSPKSSPTISSSEVSFDAFLDTVAQIADDSSDTIDDTWRIVIRGNFEKGSCPMQYPEAFDDRNHAYAVQLTNYCNEEYGVSPSLVVSHHKSGRKVVDLAATYMTLCAITANRPGGILDPNKTTMDIAEDIYTTPQ